MNFADEETGGPRSDLVKAVYWQAAAVGSWGSPEGPLPYLSKGPTWSLPIQGPYNVVPTPAPAQP